MSRISITAPAVIDIDDDHHCGEKCTQLEAKIRKVSPRHGRMGYYCRLFNREIDTCLGGGPLRCKECKIAELHSHVKKHGG